MTVTRLHPVTLPKPDISDNDRIMSALTQAIEDQKADNEAGKSARGIAIIWYREYEDGTFSESWIVQGINTLEAVGLMTLTAHDIVDRGLGPTPRKLDDDPYDDGCPA